MVSVLRGVRIGLVLVTGDLTVRAEDGEFAEAFRFIHALLGMLQLSTDHLIVIPGNHDIRWQTGAVAGSVDEGESRSGNKDLQLASRESKEISGEVLQTSLFRHEPNPNLQWRAGTCSPLA